MGKAATHDRAKKKKRPSTWREELRLLVEFQISRILLRAHTPATCTAVNWWHWCRCNQPPGHQEEVVGQFAP